MRRGVLWCQRRCDSGWVLRRTSFWRRFGQADGILLKQAEQRPSMLRVDGLWVHQGRADIRAKWDVVESVREERMETLVRGQDAGNLFSTQRCW